VNEPTSSKDVTASATSPGSADDEIRVGISSCLLGEEVRFDGGHKRDGFILGTLSPFFRFVSVCPEVEIGLGTPREAIRLVRDGDTTRLVSKSGHHIRHINFWIAVPIHHKSNMATIR
jgi:hypothetical protein